MNIKDKREQRRQELDYFYLNTAKPHGVNRAELQRDIQRGVKRLTEEAYTQHYGSTRGSLAFFITLVAMYGKDFVQAKRAVLTYDNRKHFTFTLYTIQGFEIVFKGVSGGYWGEGSRGCHDIIKASGFSDAQAKKPLTLEQFECRRRV